jgi:hypothetical protein
MSFSFPPEFGSKKFKISFLTSSEIEDIFSILILFTSSGTKNGKIARKKTIKKDNRGEIRDEEFPKRRNLTEVLSW